MNLENDNSLSEAPIPNGGTGSLLTELPPATSVFQLDYPFPTPPQDLPETDGVPLESDWHVRCINLLCAIVGYYQRDREDYYVGGNMFIYFNEEQARNLDYRGPDFFFVNGKVSRIPLRPYWAIWKEKGRYPDVIIELNSPTTKKEDYSTKKDIYEQTFGTSEYYCYDPLTGELTGWRLVNKKYQNLAANDMGWLWSEQLGLWVGTWTGPYQGYSMVWLRFYNKAGELVQTSEEAAEAKADMEQNRAAAEHNRAEDEHQRAEAERQRADALEAEVSHLKSLLASQNQPPS